jgi:phosphoglycerate dehydrogenase-like enzyme
MECPCEVWAAVVAGVSATADQAGAKATQASSKICRRRKSSSGDFTASGAISRCPPRLRRIHAPSATGHEFLFADLVNSDVLVTNSREVHGPVVAEHVMALILALAKKIPQAVPLQQKRPVQLWV